MVFQLSYFKSWKMMLWKCCTQYASKFGKLSSGHRTAKRSVFIPVPKKGNAKECSNYHTIALTSHASKVMLKILQARLQQYVNLPYGLLNILQITFTWVTVALKKEAAKVQGFPNGSAGKESACNARDTADAGSFSGSGRSPGKGNGNPLQYSCLENPLNRAWWATVHRVVKSQTRLSMFAHSTAGWLLKSLLTLR